MSRPLRLDYPGAIHHVTLRANRREFIFRDSVCRRAVFTMLAECSARFETRALAYAVMDNHIHISALSPDGRISRTLQHFTAGLTRVVNARNGWQGHVFQGRFFNRAVEDDAYLRHLPAYIHLNPERAGLADRTADPLWTSHAAYVAGDGPDWLQPGALIDPMGGQGGYARYIELVRIGRIEPPRGFEEQVLLRPRSSDLMVLPEASVSAPLPLEFLLEVAEIELGGPVCTASQGRPNPRRDLACLWAVREGHTQIEVARRLGVHRSAVTLAVRRASTNPSRFDGILQLEQALQDRLQAEAA